MCDFEIYSKCSTKPIMFRVEEIDDCQAFDIKSVVAKMRLIVPDDLIVSDDDPVTRQLVFNENGERYTEPYIIIQDEDY